MFGERGETVQHIICECKNLAGHEYKRRHDTVAKLVHCPRSMTLKEKRSGTSIALKENLGYKYPM